MKKSTIYILIIPFVIISTGSCKKFVEIDPPKNSLVTEAVFADSADAVSAVLGLYTHMMVSHQANFPNGLITIYNGLASDEIYATRLSNFDQQIYLNSIASNNSNMGNIWSAAYMYIYQSNACVEGLTNNDKISSLLRTQLLGEAKFIRAFLYFHLTNYFGAVPLIVTTDFKVNSNKPRTSVDSVYNQIITDLIDAETLLKPAYPSTGKARPNSYTAASLLAKVYLYREQWDQAITEASKVINSGMYTLENDLNNVFISGSNEAIWQLPPLQPGYQTSEGSAFIPGDGTSKPDYAITDFLLNDFETGDLRSQDWLRSKTVNSVTYYYPFKYKLASDNHSAPDEDYCMFRLADLYLIRAEAEAQKNSISESRSDLNLIRHRSGLADTPASDTSSLKAAIQHERRIEFFCEMGNRWFDLKRTHTIDQVMGAPGNVTASKGGNWSSTDQLFPIPLPEIILNSSLKQNPGY